LKTWISRGDQIGLCFGSEKNQDQGPEEKNNTSK